MPTAYTLSHATEISGIGLHSGLQSTVRLKPSVTTGIKITVNGQPLPLAAHHMRPSPLCTTLQVGEVILKTPEHLFAALHGLSVMGLTIEVESGTGTVAEIPILDGSALPWVNLIDAAGRNALTHAPLPLKVRKPTTYSAEGRVLVAAPRPLGGLVVECTIHFSHPSIGLQHWQGVVTEEIFRTELAPARSFAMQADVEAAMAAGLLKGASLESGVLMQHDNTIANLEGLRFPNEPARHKVLDFMGDSFLTGRLLQGHFILTAPGHTANNLLLRQVLEQESLPR